MPFWSSMSATITFCWNKYLIQTFFNEEHWRWRETNNKTSLGWAVPSSDMRKPANNQLILTAYLVLSATKSFRKKILSKKFRLKMLTHVTWAVVTPQKGSGTPSFKSSAQISPYICCFKLFRVIGEGDDGYGNSDNMASSVRLGWRLAKKTTERMSVNVIARHLPNCTQWNTPTSANILSCAASVFIKAFSKNYPSKYSSPY